MNQVTCDVCSKNELNNVEINSNQWEKLECSNCLHFKFKNKTTGEIFEDVNFIEKQIIKLGHELQEYKNELMEIQKELEQLLNSIGETDSRRTHGIKIPETTSDQEIPDLLKTYFDIPDDDLISQKNVERFNYECERALKQRKKSQCETNIEYLQKKENKSMEILHRIQNIPIETKPTNVQVETMAKQFEWFSELELKLRECVKHVFRDKKSWWREFVPENVKRDIEKYNKRNPEIRKLINTEDFHLLDKMTFKHLQMIITGHLPQQSAPNWSYFENIFPDYFFVNTRLRDCNSLRNKGAYHSNLLNEKQEKTLKNNAEELIGYIDDYLK